MRPGGLLLISILITILLLPLMPHQYIRLLYATSVSVIFLLAALSLEKNRRLLIGCAGILTIMIWAQIVLLAEYLSTGRYILEFIFLFVLVGGFIRQLAAKPAVSSSIFVDAVAGYLLLGFAYSTVVAMLTNLYPGAYRTAFGVNSSPEIYQTFENSNYYAFMTFSTAGYGDIVPVIPLAKSLSILISISGQLYVATIIALLISKYMSANRK
jgi:voltage-gated potassium channel